MKTQRTARIEMEDHIWHLLDEYHLVVNARLKNKNWPPVSRARLTGAILTYFFLAHHQRILSEASGAWVEEVKGRLHSVMEPEDLERFGLYSAAGVSAAE